MYAYETCRDLRHKWSRDFTFELEGNVLKRLIPCEDCESVRVEKYAVRRGHVREYLGSHIRYVKGFLVKGGFDREGLRHGIMEEGLKYAKMK